MIEFTEKEKNFLLNLLRQITINPSADDAIETVNIVQSIKEKLEEK